MLALLTLICGLVLQFGTAMLLARNTVVVLGWYNIQITTTVQYLIVGYSAAMSTVCAFLVIYYVLGIMSGIKERKKRRKVSKRED